MDYVNYKVLETYYYETPKGTVRIDIVESLSNETQWKKYSIATLCCEITKEPLDEKDYDTVIKKQIADMILYTKSDSERDQKHFNDFYNEINGK
ncbi:hypothetical protein [Staphylococcus saprophyticus]|uniref:hypothetical protein n=1 Tax=Staphylococcus saprophyticus TaxID=29385 RepID=UPI00157D76CB|nr:hypothetical protein [Staphylococcus saprophyticus]MDW4038693.1 hypothetical protein [Staphylococcus saprophyticus]MDW4088914.1 hypothetical protein [Staphylococcus saprophyticus]QKQ03435.1 hypothetical protein HSZ47_08470 [Staphylococcus saprophyticus]